MARAKYEFTNLNSLRAEALGQPGKRTFRILVEGGGGSALMWLEKDQLFQLALAIHQVLASVPEGARASGPPFSDQTASKGARLDFKVSKLVLRHDGGRGLFMIDAHDPDDEARDSPTTRVWASREQAKEFAEEAMRVCAAGRPICRLCALPIDPTGHPCPRANGHVQPAAL